MTNLLQELLQWADEHQWGWLVMVTLGLLGMIKTIDSWLYHHYSRRIDDARSWNDALEERIDDLEDQLEGRRDELQETRDQLQDARDALDDEDDSS